MKRVSHIIFMLLLAGCTQQTQPTELGHSYVLRKDSEKDTVSEHSLWRHAEGGDRLVAQFVVQGDKIVSVLPTPVSSDVPRPTAQFVSFGNGWSSVFQLYLDERGTLFRTSKGITELDEQGVVVKHPDIWGKQRFSLQSQGKTLGRIEGNVYLVVQQGAPFSRVKDLLKALGENEKISIGIGWDPSWF